MMPDNEFSILGKTIREAVGPEGLETFPCPKGTDRVWMKTEEFTSLCPVTGQPDWSSVEIYYDPRDLCLESKSLKLYLWSFRESGAFCESLASVILYDIGPILKPQRMSVQVVQKPRGGISITAQASASFDKDGNASAYGYSQDS